MTDATAASRSAIALGVFDGVHRGHRLLLGRIAGHAAAEGLVPVAMTFDPHPLRVLRPASAPAYLTTLARRVELLKESGAAIVDVVSFDEPLSRLSPEEFVETRIVAPHRPRVVVVGENFRFGHRAAGDPGTLADLGRGHGFAVEAIGVAGDAEPWSSNRIRWHLAQGDVEAAADILGRPHRLEGTVVRGLQRGRELGYPTANIAVPDDMCVPGDGVYAGWLQVPGTERLMAAVSIGTNPHFSGTERTVEAYVLDRDGIDLYDRHVILDLVERLRGMEAFADLDGLLEQMGDDVRRARSALSSG